MFEAFKARSALPSREDRKWAKGVTEENRLGKLLEAAREDRPARVRYVLGLFRGDYIHDRARAAMEAVTHEAPAALAEILETKPQVFGFTAWEDARVMRELFEKAAACELPGIWNVLHDHNAQRFAALPRVLRDNPGMMPEAPFLLPPQIAGIAAANNHAEGLARALKDAAGTPLAAQAAGEAMGAALSGGTTATLKAVIVALPSMLEPERVQEVLDRALVRAAATGSLSKAETLLAAGADHSAYHCAALVTAAMNNHDALRDRLIAAGADVRPHLEAIRKNETRREQLLVSGVVLPERPVPPVPSLVLGRLAEMAEAAELEKSGLMPVEKITLTLRRPSESPLSLTFNFNTGNVTAVGEKVGTRVLEAEADLIRKDAKRIAGAALAAGLIPGAGKGR